MHVTSKGRILVVDDQPEIRELMVRLLTTRGGYEVRTAEDGFDALLQLKAIQPDVIIADLNMPRMSGFELLSVVRRRFPEIPVVAMSGAYDSGDHVPGGVIADAFYAKGSHLEMLISIVAELIQTSAERSVSYRQKSAPVWIPRNGKDLNGVPFIVVTCTECLRSFPMSVLSEDVQEIHETPCLFCGNTVRYIIDFSVGIAAPKPSQRVAVSKPTLSAIGA